MNRSNPLVNRSNARFLAAAAALLLFAAEAATAQSKPKLICTPKTVAFEGTGTRTIVDPMKGQSNCEDGVATPPLARWQEKEDECKSFLTENYNNSDFAFEETDSYYRWSLTNNWSESNYTDKINWELTIDRVAGTYTWYQRGSLKFTDGDFSRSTSGSTGSCEIAPVQKTKF